MAELNTLGSVIRAAYESQLTDYKVIQTLSELPAPSAGVITLDTGVIYVINGAIALGTNKIDINGSYGMIGLNPSHDTLTYTGTSDMFIGSAGDSVGLFKLGLICQNGALFNVPGDGTGVFVVDSCVMDDINDIGTVGHMRYFALLDNLVSAAASGFLFTGASGGRFVTRGNSLLNNVGTLFGLGTAVYDNFAIENNQSIVTPSGSTFMSGAAGSANVGIRGEIVGNNFSGAGDVLGTITAQDLRWNVRDNAGIENTEVNAEAYISASASTALSSGTPARLSGTFSEVEGNLFSTDANGRTTYNGLDDIKLPVHYVCDLQPASGSNRTYRMTVAQDGTPISNSTMQVTLDNSNPGLCVVQALVTFTTGSYVEPYVVAVGHSTNVTATYLTAIIGA